MAVYDVWFWLPFHMLQAYPIARNLPFPDFIIPFTHLIWVPMYIAEHWTGLCDPVGGAWSFSHKIGIPFSGIFLLTFFYFTHRMTEHKLFVKICMVLYLAFMFGAGPAGFEGKPQKTQELQIAANANSEWNNQHVFLHVYYLVLLWVISLSVPYTSLSAMRSIENRFLAFLTCSCLRKNAGPDEAEKEQYTTILS